VEDARSVRVIVFAAGSLLNLTGQVGTTAWMTFWKTYVWIYLVVSVIVVIWFSTGGLIDLKKMIGALTTMTRDHSDTGFVER
jgi:hypothetical protein